MEYTRSRKAHDDKARSWTKQYATPAPPPPKTVVVIEDDEPGPRRGRKRKGTAIHIDEDEDADEVEIVEPRRKRRSGRAAPTRASAVGGSSTAIVIEDD